jgi:hypothetical protein
MSQTAPGVPEPAPIAPGTQPATGGPTDFRSSLLQSLAADERVRSIVGSLATRPTVPPRPTPADEFVRGFNNTYDLLRAAAEDRTLAVALADGVGPRTETLGPFLDRVRALRAQLAVTRLALGAAPPAVPSERQCDTLPTPRAEEPQRAGTPADADDDDARIARHIRDRVSAGENLFKITIRSIAPAVGLSDKKVWDSDTWKAFKAERGASERARVSVRTKQFKDEMLAFIRDRTAVDPAEAAERAEAAELESLLDDPEAPEAERETLARWLRTR